MSGPRSFGTERPRVIHLGLPRTGSTTLQSILRSDPRIHLIHDRHYTTPAWWLEPDDRCRSDRVNVISEENQLLQSGDFGKAILTLERMARAVPEARLLLTIREQRAFLVSRYRYNFQYHDGFSADLATWLTGGQGMDYVSLAQTSALLRAMTAFFPRERIHVLRFEDLSRDLGGFVAAVYAVIGLPAPVSWPPPPTNASLPVGELAVLRRLHRLKLFRGGGALSRLEALGLRGLARVLARTGGPHPALEWGRGALFRGLEADFAHANRWLVEHGWFDEAELAADGYLLAESDTSR